MAVVNATVNWLIRVEYAKKQTKNIVENGKTVERTLIQITPKGLAFDPEEEEKKKKILKAEAAASRKEARLREREKFARSIQKL